MRATLANVSGRSWAVWRRDLDVYLTTWQTNFLPPILEPVFYVLAFGYGLGQLIQEGITYFGADVAYLRFMVPGVVAVAIMFWAYFETTYASFVRMYYQKTFDAMVATPLLVEDVIVGELLWGTTKSLFAGKVMLLMLTILGLASWPTAVLVVPLAVAGGALFSALGLVTTAITPKIDSFNVPIFLLVFPMFLFSGTFFPVDILPEWARVIAWILPLTHVALLVRGAFLGWWPEVWPLSVAYLGLVTPALFVLSLVAMKRRLVK